ncbi:MAG: hypothetical protein ACI3Y0_07230 [Prevotella sp.]
MSEIISKHGDVKKCPACGAIVSLVQAKCPECGHEFSHVEANTTSTKLLQALEDIEVQCSKLKKGDDIVLSRKIQTIKNFPIPNTKDDLIEMLTLCQANSVDSGSEPELIKAWNTKTEQVIAKAQIALKGDKDAVFLIDQIRGNQKNKKRQKKFIISSIAAGVIALLIGGGIYKYLHDQDAFEQSNAIVEYQSKITKAIQTNDVVLAYNTLDSLNSEISLQNKTEEFAELAGNSYLKIVMSLLQEGELQDAARVGLEFRDKLNDPSKWHNHQIYKLLIQECDAQEIDTSVLE